MSTFDAAVALSQDQLNTVAAAIYSKVFPQVFTGSKTVSEMGVDSVQWSINLPPSFNLSPSSQQSAAAAVAGSAWEQNGSRTQDLTQDDIHSLVSSSVTTFAIDFPDVGVTIIPTGGGQPGYYPLSNVTAGCYIQVSGNTVSLVPQTVTCDPLPNPTDQFFVKLIILPAIQSALQSLLSGLTIPPISFEGISLSAPSVAIVDNYIVAAVNLAAKGTPGPAPTGSWTPQAFSLLLSQDLLQAGMAGQGKTFGDSGSGGDHWGGYDWHYSLSLVNPRVAISGTNLDITFSMSGSVGATAYVLQIPIGLDFDASVSPDPTAACTLAVSGNNVAVITQSVSSFTISVSPSGSIPSKVAGWIVSGIVDAIVNSITPFFTGYLRGINIATISIPTFTESVVGVKVTMAPGNMAVFNVNGYLAMGGVLNIS